MGDHSGHCSSKREVQHDEGRMGDDRNEGDTVARSSRPSRSEHWCTSTEGKGTHTEEEIKKM